MNTKELNYVETHDQFNEWHELLVFTMYQAITRIALDEYKKRSAKQLTLDDITIDIFEKFFHDNLMANGNEEYLEQYKGL